MREEPLRQEPSEGQGGLGGLPLTINHIRPSFSLPGGPRRPAHVSGRLLVRCWSSPSGFTLNYKLLLSRAGFLVYV